MIVMDREEFGVRFRKYRKRKQWTQEQAGEEIGITKQCVSLIEAGKNNPKKGTLEKIKQEFPQIWD